MKLNNRENNMEITNNTIQKLIACYEETLDPRVSELLDVVFETKVVMVLQYAFRKKHGYVRTMWLPNGTCVPVYSSRKTENIFTKQPTQ